MFAKLLKETKCRLGEGLHWDPKRKLLWFVDINSKELNSLDLMTLKTRTLKMPEKIGWVIPCLNREDLLIGLKSGIALVNPNPVDSSIKWVNKDFPGNKDLRLNDAKADPQGFIWAGSLNEEDEEKPDGCLVRYDQYGNFQIIDTGYTVTNGPAINHIENKLFHTDSLRKTIFQFDLNYKNNAISEKRVWKKFGEDYGYPDGMCFDNDGCLWVAHWGVGFITRLDPRGREIDKVDIPTPFVSNVCFAGDNLNRLIVSSARPQDKHQRQTYDLNAGSLFEIFEHGVIGMKTFQYNYKA